MDLKLYHYWRSSCSWRVRWALAIKGLSHDLEVVNLLQGDQRSATYTAKNPTGFVPGLLIDGEPFGESVAILEWLEEVHPAPALLPSSPRDRLIVRQMTQIISSGTQPIQNLEVQARLSAEKSVREEWAKYWIARGLRAYEQLLARHGGGTYSFGAEITMADLCLIPQVYNALRFDVDMSEFPLTLAIYNHCLQLPSCQAAHPDRFQP